MLEINDSKFLNDDEWKFCVKNLPIIAIDLIIKNKKSEILMGIRSNNCKRLLFVLWKNSKNENIENAFERISFTIREFSKNKGCKIFKLL